jgi:hypothetical protein
MIDYKKYRWFYTSEGTLVVGGRSAEQNDDILQELKKESGDYLVMHTTKPRSPFCVVLKEPGKFTKSEMEECATFTACFSNAWKQGEKEAFVDIFKLSQISKETGLKEGTWGIIGKIERSRVSLELALVVQEGVLRAVPIKSTKKPLMIIVPGSMDKELAAETFSKELGRFTKQDLLSALPAGGVRKIK